MWNVIGREWAGVDHSYEVVTNCTSEAKRFENKNMGTPMKATYCVITALACVGSPFAHGDEIYVSEMGGIERFDSSGSGSLFASFAAQPYGLAFDSSGSLYTAVWTYGDPFSGTIQRLDPSGAAFLFTSALGFPRFPLSLAFGSSGDLYVAVQGAGMVNKIDASGSVSIFASGLGFYPAGLGFDSSGNLYVSETGTIEKFDPSGHRSTFASGLNGPRGLAFDSGGNLYAAIAGSGIIEKFDPSGNGSVFAAGLRDPYFIAVQAVPEPSTSAMTALAAAALWGSWRLRGRLSRLF